MKKVLDDKNDIRKYLRSREESGNKVGKILSFQQIFSSILNQKRALITISGNK